MAPDCEKIKSLLCFDADVIAFDTVDSTNTLAEKLAAETERTVVIAAGSQTEGRGRNGKTFYSPDTGLYLSLVTHPHSDFFALETVTCGAAVAVCRAIEKLTELKPQIKWVNDIMLDGRKVCGILCRAIGGNGKADHLVTGVGINISTADFPDEIKNSAGSLEAAVDKSILTAEIANQLMKISDGGYMDEYREKSCVTGKEIIYYINGIPHSGKAVDIDKNGGLVVESGGERITLTGGEITVRFSVD